MTCALRARTYWNQCREIVLWVITHIGPDGVLPVPDGIAIALRSSARPRRRWIPSPRRP